MKVLLVDDDSLLVGVLEKRLHRAGHEVCWAATGQAALDLLEQESHFRPVHLAIIDVHLGPTGIDGVELCRLMRRHPNPLVRDTAAIILTGDTPSSVRARANATSQALLSVRIILTKPTTSEDWEDLDHQLRILSKSMSPS